LLPKKKPVCADAVVAVAEKIITAIRTDDTNFFIIISLLSY
jgi:hypothetical protein